MYIIVVTYLFELQTFKMYKESAVFSSCRISDSILKKGKNTILSSEVKMAKVVAPSSRHPKKAYLVSRPSKAYSVILHTFPYILLFIKLLLIFYIIYIIVKLYTWQAVAVAVFETCLRYSDWKHGRCVSFQRNRLCFALTM